MEFDENVLFFGFVDFDASGTVDLVVVVGELGKETIKIIYNSNK